MPVAITMLRDEIMGLGISVALILIGLLIARYGRKGKPFTWGSALLGAVAFISGLAAPLVLYIPCFFIIVPVVVLLIVFLAAKGGASSAAAFTYGFGMFFAGAAVISLTLDLRHVTVRTQTIERLTGIDAADVTLIRVGPKTFDEPDQTERIVGALSGVTAYAQNHGNFADDLILEIHERSGRVFRCQVAWSYEKPGAVLLFFSGDPDGTHASHGEGFCDTLPQVLEEVGLRLPRIKGYRVDDGFTVDTVTEMRIGKKVVRSREDIGPILVAMKESQIDYYRSHQGLGTPLDIVIVCDKGTYRVQAARRSGANGAVWWFLSDDGHGGFIPHGHCLSQRLPRLLRDQGSPLP